VDDPPLLDHPALAFVTINVQSPVGAHAPAGDSVCVRTLHPRSPECFVSGSSGLFGSGCPVPPVPAASASIPSKLEKTATRRPRRFLQLPGVPVSVGLTDRPDRTRFHLVTPVGCPTSGCSDPGCPVPSFPSVEAVPRGPVGVRCPVRVIRCTLHFPWSSGIFQLTGLSTEIPGCPPKCVRRPPVVHRIHTGLCTPRARSAASRVDDRASPRHNRPHDVAPAPPPRRHHHHSLAHVDPSTCACSRPPGRLFRFSGTDRTSR